jgi:hypothetical protein
MGAANTSGQVVLLAERVTSLMVSRAGGAFKASLTGNGLVERHSMVLAHGPRHATLRTSVAREATIGWQRNLPHELLTFEPANRAAPVQSCASALTAGQAPCESKLADAPRRPR